MSSKKKKVIPMIAFTIVARNKATAWKHNSELSKGEICVASLLASESQTPKGTQYTGG